MWVEKKNSLAQIQRAGQQQPPTTLCFHRERTRSSRCEREQRGSTLPWYYLHPVNSQMFYNRARSRRGILRKGGQKGQNSWLGVEVQQKWPGEKVKKIAPELSCSFVLQCLSLNLVTCSRCPVNNMSKLKQFKETVRKTDIPARLPALSHVHKRVSESKIKLCGFQMID